MRLDYVQRKLLSKQGHGESSEYGLNPLVKIISANRITCFIRQMHYFLLQNKGLSLFTPLESSAVRSGDNGCSFFGEHGV
jgi:hypothetical protein